MTARVAVEICVGDVESAMAAQVGGADRVELCDNLAVGGTTPSAGAIAECCRRLSIPVHVLIRPRGGDFVHTEIELAVIRRDIDVARELGAAGVVLGVLTNEATIDRDQTAELVALARPLRVTFHKAFDQTRDLPRALDTLIALGIDRVLTSGGRGTALDGVKTLAKLVQHASDRIVIMAGGRLDFENLETIIQQGGVHEVHLGSAVSREVRGTTTTSTSGDSQNSWSQTNAERVAAVVALVRGTPLGHRGEIFPRCAVTSRPIDV